MTDIFDGGLSPDDQTNWSVGGMIAAASSSPAVGPLPLLYCTSDFRDWPDKWHGWHLATDWGDNANQYVGSQPMDDFARWVATFYGPWSLEIIHVYSGGLPEGTALTEEWKNGVKQPAGWYGWPTLEGHRGHVHWAVTNAGLQAASAWWTAIGAITQKDWFDMATSADLEAACEAAINKLLPGIVRAVLNEGTAHGQHSWATTVQAILGQEQANFNAIRQLAGGVVAVNTSLQKLKG